MTNMVHFNVGGKQYEVSCSLLEMYPNTMLARSASEQWLPNPDAEVFVERDEKNKIFKYMKANLKLH